MTAATSTIATMSQAPALPWRDDDEAEEYRNDPRAFLLNRCALWMESVQVFHNWIITATYYLPNYDVIGGTSVKLWRPETTQDEALWQGKVGLVVGKGPLAFKDDDRNKFHGQNVEIGQWIMWDIHDARQTTVNRVHCRWIPDVRILGTVDDPKLVY